MPKRTSLNDNLYAYFWIIALTIFSYQHSSCVQLPLIIPAFCLGFSVRGLMEERGSK